MSVILACVLAAAAPPLTVTETDLGEIKAGPKATAAVKLTNRSTRAIAIGSVSGGCGCVTARASADSVAPGAAATLAVELSTLALPAGPTAWTVRVAYSADGNDGTLDVPLRATVVREVSVTPPAVAFSTTSDAEQVVVLTDRRVKPLGVTAAASTWDHLEAVVLDGLRVRVRLKASAPVGNADAEVVLTTNDPAYRELRVPVRVAKRSGAAVTASPEELALGAGGVGTFVVRSPAGNRVRVQGVESDSPHLSFRFSEAAGATAVVRVSAAAGTRGTADVRVTLAEPAGQRATVPVRWGD